MNMYKDSSVFIAIHGIKLAWTSQMRFLYVSMFSGLQMFGIIIIKIMLKLFHFSGWFGVA